jgi:transcriptional regulator of acetoin/glycerol metabolism
VILGTAAAEVARMVQQIGRSQALSRERIHVLYKEFSEGTRLSSEFQPHLGRPRVSTDEMHKERLKELILQDNNWVVFDFAESLGISNSAVKRLLKELGAKK